MNDVLDPHDRDCSAGAIPGSPLQVRQPSASVRPPPISSSSRIFGLAPRARASSRRLRSNKPSVSARAVGDASHPTEGRESRRPCRRPSPAIKARRHSPRQTNMFLKHGHAAKGPGDLVGAYQSEPTAGRAVETREGRVLENATLPNVGDCAPRKGCSAKSSCRPRSARRCLQLRRADTEKIDAVENHKRAEALADLLGGEQTARASAVTKTLFPPRQSSTIERNELCLDRHVRVGRVFGHDIVEWELRTGFRLDPLRADDRA